MKEFIRFIFINRRCQVRSGWKIGLILLSYLIIMVLWQAFFPITVRMDLRFIALDSLILFGLIFLVLRRIDRKQLKDIGLTDIRRHFQDLGFGLLLGAVSMALIFIILLISGQIVVKSGYFNNTAWESLGNGLLLFILVALREEIFSRGYCLFVFRQMRYLWLAMLLSSLIFTLLHATNPNLQAIGLLNIFLAALLFSFMTIKTGNLWMAIGYHFTWNYFQSSIFGFTVSGQELSGLYHIQIRYYNLLTGGLFGPEGGILTTGIIFIGFLIVWLYTLRRRVPPKPLPAIEIPEKHEEYC
jgi:membrane protease YdiL (CAAX protease family)